MKYIDYRVNILSFFYRFKDINTMMSFFNGKYIIYINIKIKMKIV
jgi:hypothetical protein